MAASFGVGSVMLSCSMAYAGDAIAPNAPFEVDPLKYDMGWLGDWKVSGGVSGVGAVWNNSNSYTGASGVPTHGGEVWEGATIDNALLRVQGTKGMFSFDVWAGVPPQTPVMGYTSTNVGPNLHELGTLQNPWGQQDPLFKGYATFAPVNWFQVDAGRLSSPEGTEIGVDWYNPTVFLSDLNNMQTTTATGVEVDFINPAKSGILPHYGSTFSVMLRQGYHTQGDFGELGFTGLWNLNEDGSDAIVAFGHTRLHAYTGFDRVAGYGTINSNLVGVGAFYTIGHFLINPEIEEQWLPTEYEPTFNKTFYGNIAAQITATYKFDDQWSISGQAQYIHEQGNKNLPGAEEMGNYLGLNIADSNPQFAAWAPAGTAICGGCFGPGADMLGLQANLTYQYRNLFVRPAIAYTHLANYLSGDGYGATGNSNDQFVGVIEVGWLLGTSNAGVPATPKRLVTKP